MSSARWKSVVVVFLWSGWLVGVGCGGSGGSADGASDGAVDTGTAEASPDSAGDGTVDKMTDAVTVEASPDGGDAAADLSAERTSNPDVNADGADGASDAERDAAATDGDAASADTAAADAASAVCVTLPNVSALAALAEEAGNPPAATGGQIIDGRYGTAAKIRYTGTGPVHGQVPGPRETHWFQNGTWSAIIEEDQKTRSFSATYSVVGTHTLAITAKCGDPGATSLDYTVSGTQLHLFSTTTETLLLPR
jgi:hypothetical protein